MVVVAGVPFSLHKWIGRQVLKPSYVKHSNDGVLTHKCLNAIDNTIFLFISNATEDFTNTKTEEGLAFLTLESDNLILRLESYWTRNEHITDTNLLLIFSDFQFGENIRRQKKGEAIGSPFTYLLRF